MKNLISLLVIVFLCSCRGNSNIDFDVTNNSGVDIDSVVITGLGKTKIESFKNGQSTQIKMDYSKSKTRSDGGYQIKIFEEGKIRGRHFGYYSNGLPSEDYDITLQIDTIVIKAKSRK